MNQVSGVIICLGYILGLLFTAIPWGGFWVFALGIVGAIFFGRQRQNIRKHLPKKDNSQAKTKTAPQLSQTTPHPRVWLIAGVVGLFASFYFQSRVPIPEANDISKFLPLENANNQEQLFIVRGKVLTKPRMTRSQRGQLWLQATELNEVKNENGPAGTSKGVTGKLYVTMPLLQTTGLHPSQQIAVTGVLYKPKPPLNPGGFDFQKFLQQEGAFAGLSGRQVNILDEGKSWGWWKIRERIVRSQVRSLGVPEGPLVSAMVLGSKVVDLPYETQDRFVQVGLAHALAASGFQTSLILGVILGLTSKAKKGTQIILGSIALLLFLTLTGLQASVLRAVIMGFAALIGIGLRRTVKQLGSLLVAAVLLLLFNPLWIWDLGFQLSFLATLGLIVTGSPITKRFDWLPLMITSSIAVPLAAAIWTLPLLLYVFNVVAIYTLPANIISTPFISIISIGGMISALVSLISPELGSSLANLLYHPTHWLLNLVEFFGSLPGSTVAVGSISLGQMLAMYILIILAWVVRWWQQRWWFSAIIALGLVVVPVWHSANTLFRVTVLAAGEEPVLVIQDKGKVILINSGDEGTGRFTILPFLQQQAVNKVDWAIASDFQHNGNNAWLEVLQRLPIGTFYDYSPTSDNDTTNQVIKKEVQNSKGIYQPLSVGQTITTGSVVAQLTNNQLPILQLQIFGQNWLLVGQTKTTQVLELLNSGRVVRPQVLWCPGESLKELIPVLQPQVAIATTTNVDQKTLSELSKTQTKLFFTSKDGAIQWTPNGQFETFIPAGENKTSIL
ncbi:competence protein [Brasilonema octagenarum UFV-E1]|uniref:Competence protein n=1 Tax=Brasilonema sennae CENA114 TaxID=415709 RepID=A0A856M9E5_9CYAN|nr:ComEC/Rec2 family competence protein [Brasilonema sennae]QDL07342.1 competence protein [Brasilonema sennae CENA114]QDL13705.1 competence protein [Brasilonema octagenarum UFV-E1]